MEVGDYLFGRDNNVRARSSGRLLGPTIDSPGMLSKFLESIDILSLVSSSKAGAGIDIAVFLED